MLTASILRRSLGSWFASWGILDWLRLLWCITVGWYEFAAFLWALSSCSWPDHSLSPVCAPLLNVAVDLTCPGSQAPERPAHLLLVADPQVRDLLTSRAAGFAAIRQHVIDLTLKRHWFFASQKKPDIVIFLGDILASWRFIRTDEE